MNIFIIESQNFKLDFTDTKLLCQVTIKISKYFLWTGTIAMDQPAGGHRPHFR